VSAETIRFVPRNCPRCGRNFESYANARRCPKCCDISRHRRKTLTPELSFRELQVARLVSEAKANKEIAFELRLSEGTVKQYMNRIFHKTGLSNRVGLAVWFVTEHPTS